MLSYSIADALPFPSPVSSSGLNPGLGIQMGLGYKIVEAFLNFQRKLDGENL
jgi:hypothetical protein